MFGVEIEAEKMYAACSAVGSHCMIGSKFCAYHRLQSVFVTSCLHKGIALNCVVVGENYAAVSEILCYSRQDLRSVLSVGVGRVIVTACKNLEIIHNKILCCVNI